MARISFLLDEHIPRAVADALRRRGITVFTAADAALLGARDDEYLRQALIRSSVVVTHDSDFLRLHQDGHQHAGIAFAEQGTRRIGELVAGLILIYELLEANEMEGRLEFL